MKAMGCALIKGFTQILSSVDIIVSDGDAVYLVALVTDGEPIWVIFHKMFLGIVRDVAVI